MGGGDLNRLGVDAQPSTTLALAAIPAHTVRSTADDYVDDPANGWRITTPHPFFRPIVKAQPHRRVCSWCVPPTVMSEGIEPTTHGICAACAEKVRAARTEDRQ